MYRLGDIVELTNRAVVLIMFQTMTSVELLILKSGFGMKKGEVHRVKPSEMPIMSNEMFKSLPYPLKNKRNMKWELGDIVEQNDGIFALFQKTENGFQGFMLRPSEKNQHMYPIGTRMKLYHEYQDYLM